MKHKLTEEQEQTILNEWNSRPDSPPSLLELINLAFPDQNLDGRTKEGRAVKEFLASREIKARASHEYQPKEKILYLLEFHLIEIYVTIEDQRNRKITWEQQTSKIILQGILPVKNRKKLELKKIN